MITRIVVYVCLTAAGLLGFSYYRASLIQQGYEKAVAEFLESESKVREQHKKTVLKLVEKNTEIENESRANKAQLDAYRAKFNLATEQLRKQQADFSARVEKASRESLRRYAEAAEANFAGCRSHVERLGLEAASSAGAAHTLKSALDLANE